MRENLTKDEYLRNENDDEKEDLEEETQMMFNPLEGDGAVNVEYIKSRKLKKTDDTINYEDNSVFNINRGDILLKRKGILYIKIR